MKGTYPENLYYEYYLGLINYDQGKTEEARLILNGIVSQDSSYYIGVEHILDE